MDWHALLAEHTRGLMYAGFGIVLMIVVAITGLAFVDLKAALYAPLPEPDYPDDGKVTPIRQKIAKRCMHCGTRMMLDDVICLHCGDRHPLRPTGSLPRARINQ